MGDRFEFGRNWQQFLSVVDEGRVLRASDTLMEMLSVPSLDGKTFLDVGCGSGLFSLAARRLGARVHSFDYDADSVEATRALKLRYLPEDSSWTIERGSVLDRHFLEALPKFDVVYAWGVLHHTGAMWQALENVAACVKSEGQLFIAIYNDQGWMSRVWRRVKRLYNRLPGNTKLLLTVPYFLLYWGLKWIVDLTRFKPSHSWRTYRSNRGMSPWHDVVDWVGGYPFEVAKPDILFDYYSKRGFTLQRLVTCGGKLGCNEFVFRKGRD
ncbi:MAG: methyltransferase [Acidobacteriota bacterium]